MAFSNRSKESYVPIDAFVDRPSYFLLMDEMLVFLFAVDWRNEYVPVRSFGWRLMLVCSERKVLLAGCWWLICSERKALLAGG
jgi:hypothetical protein